jgi:hypothetical protein
MKKMLIKKGLSLLLAIQAFASTAQTQINETWYKKIDQDNSDYVSSIWTNKYGSSYITGNSYATAPGATSTSHCIFTVKVSTAGQVLWSKNVFSPENHAPMSKAITGDDSGNVFILYQERYQYTDSIINRLVIRKYDPQGNTLWSKHLTDYEHGRTEEVSPREFTFHKGFLYCAGNTNFMPTSSNDLDGLLYKINAGNGDIVWRKVYDGPMSSDDMFRSYALGPNEDVWVVGRSKGMEGPGGIFSDYDVKVMRYSAAGSLQWTYVLNGSGNSDDIGLNIAVDSQGNSYHSSQIDVLGQGSDSIVVEKLSPTGQKVWRYGFIGSNSGSTRKQPLLLLPSGNVVVTSSTINGITTFCMNPATGAQLWRSHYSRANLGALDKPYELIADSTGNIYIAGGTRDSSGILDDVTTLKYNSDGVLQWYAYYNEPHIGSQDMGVSLALDAVLNVYTIGWVQDSLYNNDYFVAKYGNAQPPAEPGPGPGPTAINSPAADAGIMVFPNPADQYITLRPQQQDNKAMLSLHNIAGQTVWQSGRPQQQYRIDLQHLPSGMYILKYMDSSGIRSWQKIAVRH